MAQQYANNLDQPTCPYCGSYVERKTHSICTSCGKPIVKWDI